MEDPNLPRNVDGPRVFIAATEQNAGKTTTSLGLHALLHPLFPRIGFIKPVGQRFTDFRGKPIDEDSVLIHETFGTATPIEDMSPITVGPDFTRQHLAGQGYDELAGRLLGAFDRATWEKDFTIIEGTGHAGVGSVFGLSNARVAKLLRSKAILVVPGGIGRPIDEICLNRALFDQEEVEILGVVMNKVAPAKLEELRGVVGRGLAHLGLELLAVLPVSPVLTQPTLHEIRGLINGTIVSGPEGERNRVSHVLIGAMSSANLLGRIQAGTLLICPGDREDIILAALAEYHAGTMLSGLVLTDNLLPHSRILKLAQEARLPAIQTPLESYFVTKRINKMTVKTLPGDVQKISAIQKLFRSHFTIEPLLQKLGIPSSSPLTRKEEP
jgi:BioD-like phosphotransacetylase family protein